MNITGHEHVILRNGQIESFVQWRLDVGVCTVLAAMVRFMYDLHSLCCPFFNIPLRETHLSEHSSFIHALFFLPKEKSISCVIA